MDNFLSLMRNAEINIENQDGKAEKNQGERVVRQLSEPYQNKGRTIATNNFFTSLNLVEYLIIEKKALVGKVWKQRTFLPAEFKQRDWLKL